MRIASTLLIATCLVACGGESATEPAERSVTAKEPATDAVVPLPERRQGEEPIIQLKIDAQGRTSFRGPVFESKQGWVHEDVLDLPHSEGGAQYLHHKLRELADGKPRLGKEQDAYSDATLQILLDEKAPYAALGPVLATAAAPDVRITRFWIKASADDEGLRLGVEPFGRKRTSVEVVATIGPSSKPDKLRLALGPQPVHQTHLVAKTPAQILSTWKGLFDPWRRNHDREVPATAHRLRMDVQADVPAWTVVHLLRAAQGDGLWDLRFPTY